MAKVTFLGFVAGACVSGVLVVAASAFGAPQLMPAMLLDPAKWLTWPMVVGGGAGAALAVLRK